MSRDAAGCGGDVGGAVAAVHADREVAQGRHDGGAMAGAYLGQVLAQRYVTEPVQPVLHEPVSADGVGDLVRADLGLVEVGDRVDGLGSPSGCVQGSPAAGELDREAGVREADPARECIELQGAGLDPAVALVADDVDGGDVAPRQSAKLGVQLRLSVTPSTLPTRVSRTSKGVRYVGRTVGGGAVREMKEGPSESPCAGRLQTASCCPWPS